MIVSTPSTLGGKPRIDGHRIAVAHVAHWRYQWGWSVETIMQKFSLTQEEVQAALDYYETHKDEIDARTHEEEVEIEKLKSEYPSILAARIKRAI